jgi:hypothetical protein
MCVESKSLDEVAVETMSLPSSVAETVEEAEQSTVVKVARELVEEKV